MRPRREARVFGGPSLLHWVVSPRELHLARFFFGLAFMWGGLPFSFLAHPQTHCRR